MAYTAVRENEQATTCIDKDTLFYVHITLTAADVGQHLKVSKVWPYLPSGLMNTKLLINITTFLPSQQNKRAPEHRHKVFSFISTRLVYEAIPAS